MELFHKLGCFQDLLTFVCYIGGINHLNAFQSKTFNKIFVKRKSVLCPAYNLGYSLLISLSTSTLQKGEVSAEQSCSKCAQNSNKASAHSVLHVLCHFLPQTSNQLIVCLVLSCSNLQCLDSDLENLDFPCLVALYICHFHFSLLVCKLILTTLHSNKFTGFLIKWFSWTSADQCVVTY